MICIKLILVALLFRSMEAGGEPSKAQDCYSLESRLIDVTSNKSKYYGDIETKVGHLATLNLTKSFLCYAFLGSGYVTLLVGTEPYEVVKEGSCYNLTCEGSASPHRKIIWYRILNSWLSAFPITSYWSELYYYEITATLVGDQGISSSLIIHKFSKGYEGHYYCVLSNGNMYVQSPATSLMLSKLLVTCCMFIASVMFLTWFYYVQNNYSWIANS